MNLQKIVSKRLVGELPVGDMEVNHGSHTYLLNGVNIHNSTIVNVVMASSCPSNCSFCVSLESEKNLVELEDGRKIPFFSLFEYDQKELPRIKAHDGFVDILNRFDNGVKEVFKVTLSDGTVLECTEDHKFPTILNDEEVDLPLNEIKAKDLPLLVP